MEAKTAQIRLLPAERGLAQRDGICLPGHLWGSAHWPGPDLWRADGDRRLLRRVHEPELPAGAAGHPLDRYVSS